MIPDLPVFLIVYRAYGAVLKNLRSLVRAAIIPMVFLVVIAAIEIEGSPGWLLAPILRVATLIFVTPIAIACHRIFLLGPDSLDNPWSLYWSARESSFFTWLIILGIGTYLLKLVFGVLFLMAPDQLIEIPVPWLGDALTACVVVYLVGRFSMVLPATAMAKRTILSNSWHLTSGNGLRFALALAIPPAIAYAVFVLLRGYSGLLLEPAALALEVAWFLFAAAVEIAVLSQSFKFLEESSAGRTVRRAASRS